MGSKKSFPKHKWQFMRRDNEHYQILRNQHGELAQKHIIPNNPHLQSKQQMNGYHYRNDTDKPIVKVYDAEYQKSKGGFCSNQKNIQVKTQYIPYRLSSVRNLTQGQGMYTLSESLSGFNELYNRVGPFQVHEGLIGYNQHGKCKVWMNQNFALNQLGRDNIILRSTVNPHKFDERLQDQQEKQMVEDIFNCIDRQAVFGGEFLDRSRGFKDMGFRQARDVVNAQIHNANYYIPERLKFDQRNNPLLATKISESQTKVRLDNDYNDNYQQQQHVNNQQVPTNIPPGNQYYSNQNIHSSQVRPVTQTNNYRNSTANNQPYHNDYRQSQASNRSGIKRYESYEVQDNQHRNEATY